ncbi:MAG: XisI protein [Synechococcales bacterium]|nr:XisI protein [Synechococcales bacterium]
MDRLEQYRKAIQELLQDYVADSCNETNFETQVLCDRDHDHYQLVSLGWQGHRRFYSVLMHLDIKESKIWIQRNETDRLIAQELVSMGVEKEDIVLGLQPEYARADTGYSVA